MQKIKVCELFAGVGGFRLGLEKTGHYAVVWSNQWEPSTKIFGLWGPLWSREPFQCQYWRGLHLGNSRPRSVGGWVSLPRLFGGHHIEELQGAYWKKRGVVVVHPSHPVRKKEQAQIHFPGKCGPPFKVPFFTKRPGFCHNVAKPFQSWVRRGMAGNQCRRLWPAPAP